MGYKTIIQYRELAYQYHLLLKKIAAVSKSDTANQVSDDVSPKKETIPNKPRSSRN